jgi:hypothetical protein
MSLNHLGSAEDITAAAKLLSEALRDSGIKLDEVDLNKYKKYCVAFLYRGMVPAETPDDQLHFALVKKAQVNFLSGFTLPLKFSSEETQDPDFKLIHTVSGEQLRVSVGHIDFEKELTRLNGLYEQGKKHLNYLTIKSSEENIMVELFKILKEMRDLVAISITKQ